MMLLCCSFASASFTRPLGSLSVDCLNSKIYTTCKSSLIATPSGRLSQKRFTKTLDRGCTVPLDLFWLVLSPLHHVPSLLALPCCRFLETLLVATAYLCHFLCQAWQIWICFLDFVHRAWCHTGASRWSGGQPWLSLIFLHSLHSWCHSDRVFPSRPPHRQCSHLGPFALFCTANTLLIASCLFWQENWLLAYSCHHHPQSSPSFPWDFFVTQMLSQNVYVLICMYVCIYYDIFLPQMLWVFLLTVASVLILITG